MEKKRIETGRSSQAKSRQPNRAKNPENDRQNVAFYKKRERRKPWGKQVPRTQKCKRFNLNTWSRK